MPTLLVDADSLPQRWRAIIIRRALKDDLECRFFADRDLSDVRTAIEEDTRRLRDPYRDSLGREDLRRIRSRLSMHVVPTGADSADDHIVELADADSLVISHDIPLLERAIAKGARAMDDRGHEYDEGDIRARMGQRAVNYAMREMGLFGERQRQLDAKTLEAFSNTLDRILAQKR